MNWREIAARLGEYEAQPLQLLNYLNDLRDRCRIGIEQEKVNAKLNEPMSALERYPAIEAQATRLMYEIASDILDKAEGTQETAPLSINVVLAVPQDIEATLDD